MYLFQQPPGHPAFFGRHKVESAPQWCSDCALIRADGWLAVYWEEGLRGIVVITELAEDALAEIVAEVRKSGRPQEEVGGPGV